MGDRVFKRHPSAGVYIGGLKTLSALWIIYSQNARGYPMDMADVTHLFLDDNEPPFCKKQRLVEVVAMRKAPKDASLLCDILRQNYASIRCVLCKEDLPSSAKDVFITKIQAILKEAVTALEKVLIKKWNVPTAIIQVVKQFWLDFEMESERKNSIAQDMRLEWYRPGTWLKPTVDIQMFHKVWCDGRDCEIVP